MIFQETSLYIYNKSNCQSTPYQIIGIGEMKYIGDIEESDLNVIRVVSDEACYFKIILKKSKSVLYFRASNEKNQKDWVDALRLMKQMYIEYEKEEGKRIDVMTLLGLTNEIHDEMKEKVRFET